MTDLPHRPESAVVLPSALKGQENGKLDVTLLHPCGLRSFRMAQPAADAMRSLVGLAWQTGVRLSATGTYRPYAAQVALFTRRYSTTPTYPGAPSKVWNGERWYLRRGVAQAATPGRSNHGWGLAVDFARRNRVGRIVPLDALTLQFLADHGPRHGFYNTVASENWHWGYVLGDRRPTP